MLNPVAIGLAGAPLAAKECFQTTPRVRLRGLASAHIKSAFDLWRETPGGFVTPVLPHRDCGLANAGFHRQARSDAVLAKEDAS